MTEGLDRFARFVFADEAGNAIEVDQSFDYSFRVDKSSSRDPDTAEVSIFNLTGTNRAVLATDATTVEVYAGRTAPPKLVFKGEIVDTVSSRTEDMADWDTKITAEDTKSALRTRIVARTFAAGASLHQAIRDLAAAGGVQVDIGVSELKLPSAMSFLAPPRDARGQRKRPRQGELSHHARRGPRPRGALHARNEHDDGRPEGAHQGEGYLLD